MLFVVIGFVPAALTLTLPVPRHSYSDRYTSSHSLLNQAPRHGTSYRYVPIGMLRLNSLVLVLVDHAGRVQLRRARVESLLQPRAQDVGPCAHHHVEILQNQCFLQHESLEALFYIFSSIAGQSVRVLSTVVVQHLTEDFVVDKVLFSTALIALHAALQGTRERLLLFSVFSSRSTSVSVTAVAVPQLVTSARFR